MATNAQAVAKATRPNGVQLDRHAASLWVGKRLSHEGAVYTISGVLLTQNGLEILARSSGGALRGFFAIHVLASRIY